MDYQLLEDLLCGGNPDLKTLMNSKPKFSVLHANFKVKDCDCRTEYYSYKADYCVPSCWMKQLAQKEKSLEEDVANSLRYYPYFENLPIKRYVEVFQTLIQKETIEVVYKLWGWYIFHVLLDLFEDNEVFESMKIQLALVDPKLEVKSHDRSGSGTWFRSGYQKTSIPIWTEEAIRLDRIRNRLLPEETLEKYSIEELEAIVTPRMVPLPPRVLDPDSTFSQLREFLKIHHPTWTYSGTEKDEDRENGIVGVWTLPETPEWTKLHTGKRTVKVIINNEANGFAQVWVISSGCISHLGSHSATFEKICEYILERY